MVASAGDSSRDVVIRLRVQADQAANARAFRTLADEVKNLQGAADQAAKAAAAGANGQAKAARERQDIERGAIEVMRQRERQEIAAGRAAQVAYRETAREAQQAGREREKAARDAARGSVAAAREQERAAVSAGRAQERAAQQAARAQDQLIARHSRAARQMEVANRRMERSFLTVTHGALGLARGVAIAGLAGEENTEKLLKGLMAVEGVYGIVSSGMAISRGTRGLTRAFAARRAAAGGMGAAGAGAVGAAGAGAVGAAGVLPLLAGAAALTAAFVGTAAVINGDFRTSLVDVSRGLRQWLQEWWSGNDAAKKRAQRNVGRQDRWEMEGRWAATNEAVRRAELEDRYEQARLGGSIVPGYSDVNRIRAGTAPESGAIGLSQNLATWRVAEEERRTSAIRRQELGRQAATTATGPGYYQQVITADENQLAALTKIRDLEKERLSINQSILRDKINQTQQASAAAAAERDVLRQSRMSAMERFGQMTPAEQRQLIRIKEKADRGGATGENLTRQERMQLRGLGLKSTTEIAERGDVAAARKGGFEAHFGQMEQVTAMKLDVAVQAQNQLTVKLESDARKMAEQMVPVLQEFSRKIGEAVAAKIRDEAEFQTFMKAMERSQNNAAGAEK